MNLTNYAVGGAFSGDMGKTDEEQSNWSSWLKDWGGVVQTERFLAEMNGKADSEAPYIISIGGNDGYAVESLGVERAAYLSSDYTFEMVQNLVENGAKYILLPNRFEDQRTGLTDFSAIQNQQAVEKVDDYLALDSTPDDVEVIYGHNQQMVEKEQGFTDYGYKSMGFYLVSDWVPAYGYGLAAEDNSDIFPTTKEEDTFDSYALYSTDSDYYTPEAAGWEPDDFFTYDEYHLSNRSQMHMATYLLTSDIVTDDENGAFEKVYNDKISSFAEAIADGTIPSEYSTVYTFGDSSIDTGRSLEVTTELVENRGKPEGSSYTVESGDHLWNIAKRKYPGNQTNAQILKEVQAIYQANQDQIQNKNLIFPDQTFTLPTLNDSKTNK